MSHIPTDWVIQPAHETCCDRPFIGSAFVYLSCVFYLLLWHLTHSLNQEEHRYKPVSTDTEEGVVVQREQMTHSHREATGVTGDKVHTEMRAEFYHSLQKLHAARERISWIKNLGIILMLQNWLKEMPEIKRSGINGLTATSLLIASPTGIAMMIYDFLMRS